MALKNNTWKLNQWYDQDVAGNISYSGANWLLGAGDNNYGQLGQDNTTDYSSPVQIPGSWSQVAFSASGFGGGIKTDGTLWQWGNSDNGSIGIPQTSNRSSPIQITGGGTALTEWTEFATNKNLSIGINNGQLWVWGDNSNGRLGFGQNYPTVNWITSPKQIPGTTWAIPLHGGYSCNGCTRTDGTLWMWGHNNYGQLGQNNKTEYSSPKQIPGTTWSVARACAFKTTFAIKTDGTLWSWGYNTYGVMGQNNRTGYSSPKQIPGTTWSHISPGSESIVALKTDGTIWGWGRNDGSGDDGFLGLNDAIHRSSPTQIGSDTDWNYIESNAYSAYASKTDGTLWVWGENPQGQLGLNQATTVQYSSPVQIPGTWKLDGIKLGSKDTNIFFARKDVD